MAAIPTRILSAALDSARLRPANNLIGVAPSHSMLDQALGNFGVAPSVNTQFSIGSFPWWVNFQTKGQFVMDRQSWKAAVSGTTTQQMANGQQMADALASRASVQFMWPFLNDRLQAAPNDFTLDNGVPVTLGSAGRSSIPNVKAMIDALVKAGKTIILLADPPVGTATLSGFRIPDATQLGYHAKSRNWVMNEAPKLWPNRVFSVDAWAVGANTVSGQAGDVRDGFTRDGRHPGTLYAYPLAKVVTPVLQGLGVPSRQVPVLNTLDTYSAADNKTGAVFPATRMTGLGSAGASNPATAGGVTFAGIASAANQRPSGYGIASNSAMNAGSLAVTIGRNVVSPQSGGQADWFDLQIAGTTAANANPILTMSYLLQAGDLANLAAGDKVSVFDEFEIDAGGTGLRSLDVALVRTTPTMTETIRLANIDNTMGVLDTILAGGPMAGFHDGSGLFITLDGTETAINLYWYWHLAESANINFRSRIRNAAGRKNLPIWT